MMEDKSTRNVFRVPGGEIQSRVERVQQEMRTRDMDAIFIVQRVDLLYFSGTAQNASLFIPAAGEPLLLVKKFFPRAIEESSLPTVLPIQSTREIPGIVIDHQGRLPARLGFEWDVMPVREFQFYRKLFPDVACVDGSPAIHTVRSIKSAWELAQIQKAAEKTKLLFDDIGKHLKEGASDVEISSRAESFARAIGHGAALRIRDYQKSGFPFSSIAGSEAGRTSILTLPSIREGNCLAMEPKTSLHRGEPITLESRFFLNGYHMHEARIASIGPLSRGFHERAQRLVDLQGEILALVRAGISATRLLERSLEKARAFDLVYNGNERRTGTKAIMGNGIGLELVEHPIIFKGNEQVLREGMVLSLFSESCVDDKHSLRIRDVVLVTGNGYRKITRLPPQVLAP